jgi:hypothetical protein
LNFMETHHVALLDAEAQNIRARIARGFTPNEVAVDLDVEGRSRTAVPAAIDVGVRLDAHAANVCGNVDEHNALGRASALKVRHWSRSVAVGVAVRAGVVAP